MQATRQRWAFEVYKGAGRVEQDFRGIETERPKVRPVYVSDAELVRSHGFLRKLAYYVKQYLHLAPLLFEDDGREAARASSGSRFADSFGNASRCASMIAL